MARHTQLSDAASRGLLQNTLTRRLLLKPSSATNDSTAKV